MEVTATSRRLHVATSTRDLHPSILKYGWLINQGIGEEMYEQGHGIPEQIDIDFEEVPGIL